MNKIIVVIIVFIVFGCSSSQKNNYLGTDVRLFKGTPAWELAKAIEKDDTVEIRRLLQGKQKEYINYQEKKFGQTLLVWSVYSFHFNGFRILLEEGADIDIKAYDSTKAINWAANVYETSDYLRLLLKYNANVNYIANSRQARIVRTPLMAAAWYGLESTKLLVESGADINYYYFEGEYHNSPLYAAFRGGKMDVIHYMIVEAKADPTRMLETRLNGDSLYVCDLLRDLTFEIGSPEHKLKMEVVDYLKTQGIDYWQSPIPSHYYEEYDKEYLKKY